MNSERRAPNARSWSTADHEACLSDSSSVIEQLIAAGGLLPPDHPGQQALLPPYEILNLIEEGGMGVVLLGRHEGTSEQVAIKVLKPGVPASVQQRLPREADLQSQLNHRHIVRVLDADADAKLPYYVMPFYANGPLNRRIMEGPLDPALALSVATQVADALRYANERGVLHRDIKPSNILLDERENAHLGDFGLQLRFDRNDSLIDPSGPPQRVGTYPYMAPEVVAGKVGDARSDIYSFGASMYEMLTGRPPYDGDSADEILESIQAGPPPTIMQVNPAADRRLAQIAGAAMAYDFRERYDSWQDVHADLRRVTPGHAPVGPHNKSAKGVHTIDTTTKAPPPPRRAAAIQQTVVVGRERAESPVAEGQQPEPNTMEKNRLQIRSRITCPNCWEKELDPADLLWISSHPDLRGDQFLGDDAQKRFLPSRFDPGGFALDSEGERCQSLACPKCHLAVPRILVELKPLFISVLGAPSSGKSYFLAASIWATRQKLRSFSVTFTDADPVANQIISEYEKKLFLNDDPGSFVAIPKTEEDGELYQRVDYGTRQELYARPFLFSMRPQEQHALLRGHTNLRTASRALCLYDNAGEHFLPRLQSALSPATDHLALSEALIYVFDPLQHPRFRELCREHSSDPQLKSEFRTHRQDEVLLEAAKRIREKANLPQHEQFHRPLIVAVNKFDVWRHLIDGFDPDTVTPYQATPDGIVGVDRTLIEHVSVGIEDLLNKTAPELVAACEAFSNDVTFLPMSPQGCSPEEVSSGAEKLLGVRPCNLKPQWAEVPLLYAISRSNCSLVPSVVRNTPNQEPDS